MLINGNASTAAAATAATAAAAEWFTSSECVERGQSTAWWCHCYPIITIINNQYIRERGGVLILSSRTTVHCDLHSTQQQQQQQQQQKGRRITCHCQSDALQVYTRCCCYVFLLLLLLQLNGWMDGSFISRGSSSCSTLFSSSDSSSSPYFILCWLTWTRWRSCPLPADDDDHHHHRLLRRLVIIQVNRKRHKRADESSLSRLVSL